MTVKGINILRQLAVKSDVLVENFLPGKLSAYGLDYESLKKKAPHLIHCSITGNAFLQNIPIWLYSIYVKNQEKTQFFSDYANLFLGFGQDGPYKDRAGYDVIAASIGGLMHITGPEVRYLLR